MNGGEKVLDALLRDLTYLESAVTLCGKRVGIEGNKRVFRAMLL